MKKGLAIFLLCCLLLVIGGHALVFTIKRAEVKAAIKKEILSQPTQNLVNFYFTQSEFATLLLEDDSEFEYKGKMYDIYKKEITPFGIHITCIDDEKETALIDKFIKSQQSSSGNSSSTVLLKLLSQQFIMEPVTVPFLSPSILNKKFPVCSSSLTAIYLAIVSPPPKC